MSGRGGLGWNSKKAAVIAQDGTPVLWELHVRDIHAYKRCTSKQLKCVTDLISDYLEDSIALPSCH